MSNGSTYRSPAYYEAQRIRLLKKAEYENAIADIPKEQLIFTGGVGNTVYKLAKEYRQGNIDKILKEEQTQTIQVDDPTNPGNMIDKEVTLDKYQEPVREGIKDFFVQPDPVMTPEYYEYLTTDDVGVTDMTALNQTSRDFISDYSANHDAYNTRLANYNTRTEELTDVINKLDKTKHPSLDIGNYSVDDIKANIGLDNDLSKVIFEQDIPFMQNQESVLMMNNTLGETTQYATSAEDIMTTTGPSGFGGHVMDVGGVSYTGVDQGVAPSILPSGFLPGGKKPDGGLLTGWKDLGMLGSESREYTNVIGKWDLPGNINTTVAKILPGDIQASGWLPGGAKPKLKIDLPFVNEERVGQVWSYLTKGKKAGETAPAFAGTAADLAAKTGTEKLSKLFGVAGKGLLVVGGVMAMGQLASDDPETRKRGAKNAFTTAVSAYALYSPEPVSKVVAGVVAGASLLFDMLGIGGKKRSYAQF